jgi:hypothetical protein
MLIAREAAITLLFSLLYWLRASVARYGMAGLGPSWQSRYRPATGRQAYLAPASSAFFAASCRAFSSTASL